MLVYLVRVTRSFYLVTVTRSSWSVMVVRRLVKLTLKDEGGVEHMWSRWIFVPSRVCVGSLNAGCTWDSVLVDHFGIARFIAFLRAAALDFVAPREADSSSVNVKFTISEYLQLHQGS